MQDIITGDCKNKYKKHLPAIIISGLLAIFLKVSLNYKSGGTLYTGNFASNMGGVTNMVDIDFHHNKRYGCSFLSNFPDESAESMD